MSALSVENVPYRVTLRAGQVGIGCGCLKLRDVPLHITNHLFKSIDERAGHAWVSLKLSSEGFSQTCFWGEIQTVFTSAFDVKQKVLLLQLLGRFSGFVLQSCAVSHF